MATVDLHVHTTWSDGRLTPREVIQEAAKLGLSAIAVTDHDVVGGLDEAAEAAAEVGIDLVPAVELTAGWRGRTVHMLGYFIDPYHVGLQAGGVTALAHPGKINRREPHVSPEALQSLLEAGLDGLEAWNVAHSLDVRDYYRALADQLGIVATGGSDCHGRGRTALRLGSQNVPSQALDALREVRRFSSMRP